MGGWRSVSATLWLALSLTGASCSILDAAFGGSDPAADDGGPGGDGGPPDASTGPIDPRMTTHFIQALRPNRDLDLLFVIDNSAGMLTEQSQLVSAFQPLVDELSQAQDGLPNLRIGVITTDLGTAPHSITQCEPGGDGAQLQSAPTIGGCTPPSDPFIEDVRDTDGSRIRNFPTSLFDVFNCIANVGDSGCGFEQPLEAMRTFLDSNPQGFLRPDARLGVVIVSDEDDCSATNPNLFDTNGDPTTELGPISSYRCFQFGVVCDESIVDDPVADRFLGERTNCRSTKSNFMDAARDYTDAYTTFLGSRHRLSIAVIAAPAALGGEAGKVLVTEDVNGNSQVAASCSVAGEEGDPAVRLEEVAAQLGSPGLHGSVCDASYNPAMMRFGSELVAHADGRCLAQPPADVDPGTAGLQPHCIAFVEDGGAVVMDDIPVCDAGTSGPCLSIASNTALCPKPPSLEVVFNDGGAPLGANQVAVIACASAPPMP